jgi:hypothetical protein
MISQDGIRPCSLSLSFSFHVAFLPSSTDLTEKHHYALIILPCCEGYRASSVLRN